MGQVDDVSRCVTMDLKQAGNLVYLVGETGEDLGGSHFSLVNELEGGQVPTVNVELSKRTFAAMHAAICGGLLRACHDLSEGGLAVAAAEMAFAGGLGAQIDLSTIPTRDATLTDAARLFSESNTRFMCEVEPENATDFEAAMSGVPYHKIGEVTNYAKLNVSSAAVPLIDADVLALKEAWKSPLRW